MTTKWKIMLAKAKTLKRSNNRMCCLNSITELRHFTMVSAKLIVWFFILMMIGVKTKNRTAHNEGLMERDTFNNLWAKLTAELNSIGPPAFSDAVWKRKWSIRKYNKKRRRSIDSTGPDKSSGKFIYFFFA